MAAANWRPAEVEDIPALENIQAEMSARMGKSPELQNPLKFPALKARVFERDGEVIGCVFFQLEMQVTAVSPRFAAEMLKITEELKDEARSTGIRFVLADLEPAVAEILSKPLEKARFKKLDGVVRYFLDLEKS